MKTRFYEIDLLRFLSAFAVVIFHYTYTGFMEGFSPNADFSNMREITRYAYMGINFFFVISGFVIFMSVADGSATNFLRSRFIRLFPAYWAALILTTLVTILWGNGVFTVTWQQFLTNITMINEVFGEKPIDSAYWTLFIELKFYLVVLISLCFGWMKHFQHIIAVTLVSSTAMLFHPWAKEVDMFVAIFPHWSGYFAAGGVFYLIRRDGVNVYKLSLLMLSYFYIIKQSTLFGSLMSAWFAIEFSPVVIIIINSVFFALFCVTAFCKNNPLRQPWCYYLGILTYPLYLIHQHIGYMIFNLFHDVFNNTLLIILTTVLMLIVAYFIHLTIEVKSAQILKKRIKKKQVVHV